MRVVAICAAAVLGLAVAGCGGGEDKDKEAAGKPCGPAPAAMAGKPTLPPKFPTPSEVTYTGSKNEGPTTVVSGYWGDGDLTAAHHGYSSAFTSAGYTVTHEEQDAADSEVNFTGSGKSGQVKLSQRCKDRIMLTVTIRPA